MARRFDLRDDRDEALENSRRMLKEARTQLAATRREIASARELLRETAARLDRLEAANAELDRFLGRKP